MIRMVLERNTHKGRPDLARPRIFCDYCERPIDDARGGLYMWDARLENEAFYAGEPQEVYTVHKGACDRGFCARMGWQRHGPHAGELRLLPLYLGNSAAVDWQKARELAGNVEGLA